MTLSLEEEGSTSRNGSQPITNAVQPKTAAPALDESLPAFPLQVAPPPSNSTTTPPPTHHQQSTTNAFLAVKTEPTSSRENSTSAPLHPNNGNDNSLRDTNKTDTKVNTDTIALSNNSELAEPDSAIGVDQAANQASLPTTTLNTDPPQQLQDLQQLQLQPSLIPTTPVQQSAAFDLEQAAPLADPSSLFAQRTLGLFPQNHLDAVSHAMMNLFSMKRDPPPPRETITPGEVDLNRHYWDTTDDNDHRPYPMAKLEDADPGLQSFARLEFADSVFQITTYAVEIGRDQKALEQARRTDRREQERARIVADHINRGIEPPPPQYPTARQFARSYVSEEGGMLGPESDDENPRPAKRRKTGSGSGSQHGGGGYVGGGSEAPQTSQRLTPQYVSHTPGAAAVDISRLRPALDYVPFIGIHSPGPDIASKTKAISRKHLMIEYNQEDRVFEAIALHKNGFFHNDVHYSKESDDHIVKVALTSGDNIQIKDVRFVFWQHGVDPPIPDGDSISDEGEVTSSKRYSEGGKSMSFEFESSHAGEVRETSEETNGAAAMDVDGSVVDGSELEDEDAEEEVDGDEEDDQDVRETVESDENEGADRIKAESELPATPPKKRGPGRPPKNGIMSKREERLLKKAAAEEAKKNLPPEPPGEPPIKRKVGRPRKNPLPEDGERPEKRKYKPRKPKNPDEVGSDGEKVVKEKKREKPKTPPLELRMEDFTPEQLEKPNKNYGVLIDEVLSDAPQGLTLKQIYKRIQQKYPFYYFTVETKGWESSVRHNLIGNDAFKKVDETHLWFRVEGVELDAGKKRKATSPDRSQSAQRGVGYPQMPHGQYQPGMVPGPHGYAPQHPGAPQYPNTASGQVYGGPPGAHQAYNPAMAAPVNSNQPSNYAPGAPQQGYANAMPAQIQGSSPGITATQAPAHNPPAAPHQPQQGAQPGGYNPAYTQTPMAQPGMPANMNQTSATTQGASQPLPAMQRAPTGPAPHQGVTPGAPANGVATGPAGPPGALQPGSNGAAQPPVELKPAIDPDRMQWLLQFKQTVMDQTKQRTVKGEAVAMSVLNRGLGLSSQSIVPEEVKIEDIISGVFVDALHMRYSTKAENDAFAATVAAATAAHAAAAAVAPPGSERPVFTKPTRPNPNVLDRRLVERLIAFKTPLIAALGTRLGAVKADALLMSVIDRALGLTQGSIMFPENEKEKKDYEEAEKILLPMVVKEVEGFRHMVTYGPST